MRKFKHKTAGYIAEKLTTCEKYKLKISTSDIIPAWVIENSNDWEEIIEKDYEILEFKSIQGLHCEKGQYSFDVVSQYGNTSEWYIYKIRRKSDGVEFKIGDKLDFSDDDDKCYKSITEISLNSIGKEGIGKRTVPWLQCGKDYGTCLEYAQLVKEPILITEDGYECALDDRVFGVLPKANWQTNYFDGTGVTVKSLFNVNGERFNKSSQWLYFKTKENAEKYIYENKPEFSRKQIWSWFRETPLVSHPFWNAAIDEFLK